MSRYKVFAIKHKQTGKLMPTPGRNGTKKKNGATYWDPSEINTKRKAPRLFEDQSDAQIAVNKWEDTNGKGRLVVVPVTITEDLLEW